MSSINLASLKTAKLKPKSKAAFLIPTNEDSSLKASLAKGTTKAKTATTTDAQKRLADKIKLQTKNKTRLSSPGELARCRAITGGNVLGGVLLYRLVYLYRTINPKLARGGKEYLAMSRADLALSAGLTESELKNKALLLVRKYAWEFLTIEAMGRGHDKKLWFHVDLLAYRNAVNDSGYELKVAAISDAEVEA